MTQDLINFEGKPIKASDSGCEFFIKLDAYLQEEEKEPNLQIDNDLTHLLKRLLVLLANGFRCTDSLVIDQSPYGHK